MSVPWFLGAALTHCCGFCRLNLGYPNSLAPPAAPSGPVCVPGHMLFRWLSTSLPLLALNQVGFELQEGGTFLAKGTDWSKIWRQEKLQAAQVVVKGKAWWSDVSFFISFLVAVHGLSLVALHGLLIPVASSCPGAWALGRLDSVVVALGLSCSAACRILGPGPGVEPVCPALAGEFSTTGPPRKSPM